MKVDSKILFEMIDQQIEAAEQGRNHMIDHEGRMAKGELRDMIKNGLIIYKSFDKNDELPGWISAYITLASDYMHSVMEYMVEDKSEREENDDQDMEYEDEIDS